MSTITLPLEIWQLIANCLTSEDQHNLSQVSTSFKNLIKYKTVAINITPKTYKDHMCYNANHRLNIKIECDSKYVRQYIQTKIIGWTDDYGINETPEQYIKNFIYTLFGTNFPIASHIDECVDNKWNHMLIKNNDLSFSFYSRMNQWDFITHHLDFDVIVKI